MKERQRNIKHHFICSINLFQCFTVENFIKNAHFMAMMPCSKQDAVLLAGWFLRSLGNNLHLQSILFLLKETQ